ncbi:MAG TPA: TIM44-like domain-containing protein [Flavobacteriales bacterium]|nr:TIM44-like domain-containing protein [Flavobacteriales bacterium]
MTRFTLYKALTVACIVFISLQCIARSGGGGGDFSGGDSDAGAILEIASWILYLIPFPYNFIVLGVFLLLCALGARKYKQSSSLNTIQKVNSGFTTPTQLAAKMALLGNFNEPGFIEKSKQAFTEVQRAWEKKNLGPVRKYISDGVYQRFNTQILMMNQLGQTNTISHLKLLETKIALIEIEDPYEIIHVQYKAEITDSFVSEKYAGINQKYNEEFIEFWTYIRKKTGNKDLYQNNNCPNCGDALPEMGEVSKCPSCQTYTNTGEFDWILCEITQPEEFIDFVNNMSQKNYLSNRLREYKAEKLNTNTQFLEDKASNAYLQIRVAHALKDMSRICRFSTKEFFGSVQNMDHEPYLFNRIFLRDVSMINILENDTHYFAAFAIQCKEQKVIIRRGELHKMDQALTAVTNILVMTLAKNNETGKHSVLAHNCSQCGGPVGDTVNLNCQYCGNQLNDEKKDWVVCGLMSREEYAGYKTQFTTRMVSDKKEEEFIEIDMHARDFAINNMMVIMMADGSFGNEEREYAVKVAKKLGFNSKKISALWEHTSANKLGIIMPDDKKSRQKVFKYMKKAAKIDGIISQPEQNILDDVKAKYELADN